MNICLNKKEAPLITSHCIHLIQYCHDHHHSSIHKHCKCLKTFDLANFCNLLILLFFANFRFCKFSIYKHCRSPCMTAATPSISVDQRWILTSLKPCIRIWICIYFCIWICNCISIYMPFISVFTFMANSDTLSIFATPSITVNSWSILTSLTLSLCLDCQTYYQPIIAQSIWVSFGTASTTTKFTVFLISIQQSTDNVAKWVIQKTGHQIRRWLNETCLSLRYEKITGCFGHHIITYHVNTTYFHTTKTKPNQIMSGKTMVGFQVVLVVVAVVLILTTMCSIW